MGLAAHKQAPLSLQDTLFRLIRVNDIFGCSYSRKGDGGRVKLCLHCPKPTTSVCMCICVFTECSQAAVTVGCVCVCSFVLVCILK